VNREGRLKAGAFARGEIVTAVDDAAVMVPRNAVVTFAGIHKVFAVRDGKAVEHRVRLGAEQGDWVEIVGGLQSDAVVAPGLPGISHGAPVTVVER
jgi:multidrug efflux pump subunit AcrA (membrane-fusion protein)